MEKQIPSLPSFPATTTTTDDLQAFTKKIDIFQHLKLNIRNEFENCKCLNTQQFYCIPCKTSICKNCTYDEHKTHILINKQDYTLSHKKIKEIFDNYDSFVASHELLSQCDAVKSSLQNEIDAFVESIITKLNKFKANKYQEIDTLFGNLPHNAEQLQKNITKTKSNLSNYLEKNKKFFNLPTEEANKQPLIEKIKNPSNLDQDNTNFLLNYDIINLLNVKHKELMLITDSLEEAFKNYKSQQKDELDTLTKQLHDVLFPVTTKNNTNNNSQKQSMSVLQKKEQQKAENNTFMSKNPHRQHQHDDVLIDNSLITPSNQFIATTDELSDDLFDNVNNRIDRYNRQIDSFKKGVFNTYKKFGNLKEIERLIAVYEKTKTKGADALFMNKKNRNAQKSKAELELLSHPKLNLENRDDVCLNNPLLEKYFSYLAMDLYGKHFKLSTKELQSSHADLMIKVNEDDNDDCDYGKAIEGTNEISLYEKKTNKITKRQLKLTKNPFGYTKFPIGCRSLLIGDKLYITGGKDEQGEFGVVLVYNRKKKTLKRIMDLREPRAYHTMIFNEVFSTIMVFGGENISSVEIFDPLTNRWQLLPDMNIPRANLHFYFDKPRGIMYTLFGVEGSCVGSKYSDVIEFLDLGQAKNGWLVLDYKNKSEIDLRNYMNIYPLGNDLVLLYGGVSFRNTTKSICLLNLLKSEVVKVDQKMLEQLRIEAKKSRKLSSIVSGLTLSTASIKQ